MKNGTHYIIPANDHSLYICRKGNRLRLSIARDSTGIRSTEITLNRDQCLLLAKALNCVIWARDADQQPGAEGK